jgi:hypothetical protein
VRRLTFALAPLSILLIAAISCGSEPSDSSASNNTSDAASPVASDIAAPPVLDVDSDNTSNIASAVTDLVRDAPEFSVPVVKNNGNQLFDATFSLNENRGKSTVLYFSFEG